MYINITIFKVFSPFLFVGRYGIPPSSFRYFRFKIVPFTSVAPEIIEHNICLTYIAFDIPSHYRMHFFNLAMHLLRYFLVGDMASFARPQFNEMK